MPYKTAREGWSYNIKSDTEHSMTYIKIAEELGIGLSTVQKNLYRALTKVAHKVFIGMNDREPTEAELNTLASNPDFQLLVCAALKEKRTKSRESSSDV